MGRPISDAEATLLRRMMCYGPSMTADGPEISPEDLELFAGSPPPETLAMERADSPELDAALDVIARYAGRILDESRDPEDLRQLMGCMLAEPEPIHAFLVVQLSDEALSVDPNRGAINWALELAQDRGKVFGDAPAVVQAADSEHAFVARWLTAHLKQHRDGGKRRDVDSLVAQQFRLLAHGSRTLARVQLDRWMGNLAQAARFKALRRARQLQPWLAKELLEIEARGLRASLQLLALIQGNEVPEDMLATSDRLDAAQVELEARLWHVKMSTIFDAAEQSFAAGQEEFYPFGKPDDEPY